MKTSSAISIEIVTNDPAFLDDARDLLQAYYQWRNYDEALGDHAQELKDLPGEFRSPDGKLLVAYAENKCSGIVAYRRFDQTTCEMKRMYVLPEFRKRGIGRILGQAILVEARKAGYTRMLLDTHPHMKEAQKLYLELGFKETTAYHFNPTPGIRFFEKAL